MTPSPSRDPIPTGRSLRAALFVTPAAPEAPVKRAVEPSAPVEQFAGATAAHPYGVAPAPVTPSPAEVLSASPAVMRLCESYHKAEARLTHRARRQRMGIFLLVCAISVSGMLLRNSGALTSSLVTDLVLAVAGASSASIGLLALLWLRDGRRLRGIQGERLLRALQASCKLPSDRLYAFRRSAEPVTAFFLCYAAWRSEHAPGAAGGLFKKLRQTRA